MSSFCNLTLGANVLYYSSIIVNDKIDNGCLFFSSFLCIENKIEFHCWPIASGEMLIDLVCHIFWGQNKEIAFCVVCLKHHIFPDWI